MQEEVSAVKRMQEILRSMETEIQVETEGISQEDPVPPPGLRKKPQKVAKIPETQAEERSEMPLLQLDSENILRGIILSEVLGKPVSKRRGRW